MIHERGDVLDLAIHRVFLGVAALAATAAIEGDHPQTAGRAERCGTGRDGAIRGGSVHVDHRGRVRGAEVFEPDAGAVGGGDELGHWQRPSM